MSHDRGCYCGKESYEYEDCTKNNCYKKIKYEKSKFKLGDRVAYKGKTYTFTGEVVAVTTDGQYVVSAINPDSKYFTGMKHIYGKSQLEEWVRE